MTPEEMAKLLQTELKGIEQNIMPLLDTQREEIKRHGETSAATSASLKELESKWDERQKDLDGVREQLEEIKKDLGENMLPGSRKASQRKTPGQLFIESEEFKNADLQNHMVSPVELKALYTGASLGEIDGFLGTTHRQSPIFQDPDADLHIRDLLPVTPTDAASILYIERTGARWVAGVQQGEGAEKTEQALNFAQKQANPVTIAHYLPITRQALSRSAQLRAYIDNELIYGLRLAEDVQLLYGDGSANNLLGLMANPNVQNYTRFVSGDTFIDTIRRAVTQLRLRYFRPSGVILHPSDFETIELQKDNEARYLWVTVTDGGAPRLWRVPVVETPAINEGEFLMGDFGIGAHLWDLEQARNDVGYVNDDFIKNRLVLRGEEDLIFTTELPGAFVKGNLDGSDFGDGEGEGESE